MDGVFLTDLRRDDRASAARRGAGPAGPSPSASRAEPDRSARRSAIDDRVGVREAVDHLIVARPPSDRLRRRPTAAMSTRLRANSGLAGGAHAAGLPIGPAIAADFTGCRRRGSDEPAPRARTSGPTAVVFANDLMAIAGMSVAAQAGIDVPRELSIVGFDDIPLAATCNPPLTTVRQDVVAWGRAAAAALLCSSRERERPGRDAPPVAARAPRVDCARARAREEGRPERNGLREPITTSTLSPDGRIRQRRST